VEAHQLTAACESMVIELDMAAPPGHWMAAARVLFEIGQ